MLVGGEKGEKRRGGGGRSIYVMNYLEPLDGAKSKQASKQRLTVTMNPYLEPLDDIDGEEDLEEALGGHLRDGLGQGHRG